MWASGTCRSGGGGVGESGGSSAILSCVSGPLPPSPRSLAPSLPQSGPGYYQRLCRLDRDDSDDDSDDERGGTRDDEGLLATAAVPTPSPRHVGGKRLAGQEWRWRGCSTRISAVVRRQIAKDLPRTFAKHRTRINCDWGRGRLRSASSRFGNGEEPAARERVRSASVGSVELREPHTESGDDALGSDGDTPFPPPFGGDGGGFDHRGGAGGGGGPNAAAVGEPRMKAALRRVLLAHSCRNSVVGYCQCLNHVARRATQPRRS